MRDLRPLIDAVAVLKAAQAISGEIVLERLLDTLMRIALEKAGAQKGVLLLAHGAELAVEIEAVGEHGGGRQFPHRDAGVGGGLIKLI